MVEEMEWNLPLDMMEPEHLLMLLEQFGIDS